MKIWKNTQISKHWNFEHQITVSSDNSLHALSTFIIIADSEKRSSNEMKLQPFEIQPTIQHTNGFYKTEASVKNIPFWKVRSHFHVWRKFLFSNFDSIAAYYLLIRTYFIDVKKFNFRVFDVVLECLQMVVSANTTFILSKI